MVKAVHTVIGMTITVLRGVEATCRACQQRLVTEGNEQVIAHEVRIFNRRGSYPTGKVGWSLDCPTCGYLVDFDSRIAIRDWRLR